MNRRLTHVGLTLAAVAVAAGLFATAGVYNVSARVGHWPITAWILHFMMRQSAQTHALGIDAPPLDDPRQVIRGATWFSLGCAACHGEPGSRFTPIVHHMTPEAPSLSPLVASWNPRELFWIVDNGIKYTGMPAWSTPHRKDEVWDMVAFLMRLPELDPDEYRALAFPPSQVDVTPSIANLELDERLTGTLEQCARCHGYDGMGRATGAFPFIGGQSERYLFGSLTAFAGGHRASGIMQPIAAGLNVETIAALARHYARSEGPARGAPEPAGDVRRGAELATSGAGHRVPACRHCHGPGPLADNTLFPMLAGQNYEYLVTQLTLWRAGTRGGTEWSRVMTAVAEHLTDRQIRNVAAFYASLPWTPAAGQAPPPSGTGAAGAAETGTDVAKPFILDEGMNR